MFRLRGYQTRCLEALESYLELASQVGAKTAFVLQTERPYRSVSKLPALPYVCLRVPTGGGKTVMAAHSVGIAASRWTRQDRAVCLWLVPSNAIREQTLSHLRTIGDPYRDALMSRFPGPVTVMDLAEALHVQRASLDGATVIIVATLAALRQEDTEGLRVYRQNGALQHHFEGLASDLFTHLEKHANGVPVASLENVLRLRRPIVIMDEAHNARTELSFDTLARFAPSCVIEFTATPETINDPERKRFASNVLAHVSAAELKAEEMIKLPVRLFTRTDWSDAVGDALSKQRELEQLARSECLATGERIRPIVLFQAQNRREGLDTVVPEALKQALTDDFHVAPEQIAVETGTTRDLDGVDINDPDCPIRYVITVQALREGWDCPSAYVLCSIAEQASPRAVEQLLGRVLRMPSACRKQHAELNVAYAFVVSNSFAAAAANLKDALVEAGFQKLEAELLIQPGVPTQTNLLYASPTNPVRMFVPQAPVRESVGALRADVSGLFTFDYESMTLVITGPVAPEAAEKIAACFPTEEAKQNVRAAAFQSRTGTLAIGSGNAAQRDPIRVPLLAVSVNGVLELFEETHFADETWRLAQCDSLLSEAEFPLSRRAAQEGVLDVTDQGRIEFSFHEGITQQLALLEGEPGWTMASLAVWLDTRIPHPDVTQPDARLFIHNALGALIQRGNVTIQQLAREKNRLCKALEGKIATHRSVQRSRAFQQALFDSGAPIEVSESFTLGMGDPEAYSPNFLYDGPYQFRKHLFPVIGELPSEGEELDCAVFLDEHEHVASWARNLANRPETSFWLQTSTDRFYPDFVGELKDGRIFAVEYKGLDRWSNDDSREKRAVGSLWAAASKGLCLFLMPQGPDWAAIDSALIVKTTAPQTSEPQSASAHD